MRHPRLRLKGFSSHALLCYNPLDPWLAQGATARGRTLPPLDNVRVVAVENKEGGSDCSGYQLSISRQTFYPPLFYLIVKSFSTAFLLPVSVVKLLLTCFSQST